MTNQNCLVQDSNHPVTATSIHVSYNLVSLIRKKSISPIAKSPEGCITKSIPARGPTSIHFKNALWILTKYEGLGEAVDYFTSFHHYFLQKRFEYRILTTDLQLHRFISSTAGERSSLVTE